MRRSMYVTNVNKQKGASNGLSGEFESRISSGHCLRAPPALGTFSCLLCGHLPHNFLDDWYNRRRSGGYYNESVCHYPHLQ